MNYRHIYHAGNFADVLKHIVLMQVIGYLQKKDKPYFVLDTHAGVGKYDLQGEKHQKTNESDAGILKLLSESDNNLPDEIQQYIDLVKSYGSGKIYPGSPEIIRSMLRSQDKAIFNELHPDDFNELSSLMENYKRVKVENKDAYECMNAILPHHIKRGLVLIDPPFEVKNEFDLMANAIKKSYKKFSHGIYALWYPIKDKEIVENFYNSLKEFEIKDILTIEFYIDQYEKGKFSGTGLILINPPWVMEEKMKEIIPILSNKLSNENGSWKVKKVFE